MTQPRIAPPAYTPPKAPDAVMYFRGHMDRLELFAQCFGGIERSMGYRQPNILWGTLAMARPTPMPDGAVVYRVDLPKPVYLSDVTLLYATDGSMLWEGHYTGRISLHLSDDRFAPAFSTMSARPTIQRRDPRQILGHCEITLCLENLRRIELPDDATTSLPVRLWTALVDMRRSAVETLTSLLHPDTPSDLKNPLF